jgi:ankyrin repeat protein
MRALDQLFQGLPEVRTKVLPLREVLEREAAALLDAHGARQPAALALLRLHGGWKKLSDEETFARPLTLEQARAAVASLHRFRDWADVLSHGDDPVDPLFESAADAIVAGDASALRALLARAPSLIAARSPYHHRSTLLHYVAANGVEEMRQWQSPPNAVEMARILLDAGADPDATCPCYGPADTPLYLLVTSGHPAGAGTQADLVEVLCQAGASPNGRDDDGWPFWEAIKFQYKPAALALARAGARIDNLLFAAATGDLPATRAFFDPSGTLNRTWGRARAVEKDLPLDRLLEWALIWAAAMGQTEVVRFLLEKDPDLNVREPFWGATALEAAKFHERDQVVQLLQGPCGNPVAP